MGNTIPFSYFPTIRILKTKKTFERGVAEEKHFSALKY